jgi:hypothetical protein
VLSLHGILAFIAFLVGSAALLWQYVLTQLPWYPRNAAEFVEITGTIWVLSALSLLASWLLMRRARRQTGVEQPERWRWTDCVIAFEGSICVLFALMIALTTTTMAKAERERGPSIPTQGLSRAVTIRFENPTESQREVEIRLGWRGQPCDAVEMNRFFGTVDSSKGWMFKTSVLVTDHVCARFRNRGSDQWSVWRHVEPEWLLNEPSKSYTVRLDADGVFRERRN